MDREYKTSPQFTKEIDGRTVTGIFCVHGNIDEGGDRSHPGMFGDGTVNGRKRAVFLWQHDSWSPPIATIDQIYEVSKADLPPAVLAYAPECVGGVAVKRTYLNTPRADEVLTGIMAGAICEMSYAYQPKRWDYEEAEDGRTVRNLYECQIYDISDVNWGMNPATSADGRKGIPLHLEHDTVHAAVHSYIKRLEGLAALRAKEGRVLSGENRKRIESTIEALAGAITSLKDLLAASEEPKQQDNTAELRRLFLETQRTLAQLNGVAL